MSSHENIPSKHPVKKRLKTISLGVSLTCRFCATRFENPGIKSNHERSCNARQGPVTASANLATKPTTVNAITPAPPPVSHPSTSKDDPGNDASAPDAADPEVPDGAGGFDLSYELCKLMWLANQKRGLPDKDRQTLLDIFNKAEELGLITVPLSYRTLDELKVRISKISLHASPTYLIRTCTDVWRCSFARRCGWLENRCHRRRQETGA
jgi:hypothetical protein